MFDSPYVLTIVESMYDDFFDFVAVLRTTEITSEEPLAYESTTGYQFVIQLQGFDENQGQLASVLEGLVPGAQRPSVDINYLSGLTGTLTVTDTQGRASIRLTTGATVSLVFRAPLTTYTIAELQNLSTVQRRVRLELRLEINELDSSGDVG